MAGRRRPATPTPLPTREEEEQSNTSNNTSGGSGSSSRSSNGRRRRRQNTPTPAELAESSDSATAVVVIQGIIPLFQRGMMVPILESVYNVRPGTFVQGTTEEGRRLNITLVIDRSSDPNTLTAPVVAQIWRLVTGQATGFEISEFGQRARRAYVKLMYDKTVGRQNEQLINFVPPPLLGDIMTPPPLADTITAALSSAVVQGLAVLIESKFSWRIPRDGVFLASHLSQCLGGAGVEYNAPAQLYIISLPAHRVPGEIVTADQEEELVAADEEEAPFPKFVPSDENMQTLRFLNTLGSAQTDQTRLSVMANNQALADGLADTVQTAFFGGDDSSWDDSLLGQEQQQRLDEIEEEVSELSAAHDREPDRTRRHALMAQIHALEQEWTAIVEADEDAAGQTTDDDRDEGYAAQYLRERQSTECDFDEARNHTCAICLGADKELEGQTCIHTMCKHVFHAFCLAGHINSQLAEGVRPPTCPLCRQPLLL